MMQHNKSILTTETIEFTKDDIETALRRYLAEKFTKNYWDGSTVEFELNYRTDDWDNSEHVTFSKVIFTKITRE